MVRSIKALALRAMSGLGQRGQYDDAVGAEVTRPAGLPGADGNGAIRMLVGLAYRQQWPNRNDNSRGQYRFSERTARR